MVDVFVFYWWLVSGGRCNMECYGFLFNTYGVVLAWSFAEFMKENDAWGMMGISAIPAWRRNSVREIWISMVSMFLSEKSGAFFVGRSCWSTLIRLLMRFVMPLLRGDLDVFKAYSTWAALALLVNPEMSINVRHGLYLWVERESPASSPLCCRNLLL